MIRRYSIGARGEKVFHEDGPHVSYEDYQKVVQELRQLHGTVEFDKRKAPPTENFWEKLGGDRKTL